MSRKLKINENKGITLIALIITIIILIILTAVTINNVIGTDLIGFATKATGNYIDAERKEQSLMNDIINEMGIGKGEESSEESSENPDPPQEENKKLSELVTESNYGDYINYPVNLDIGDSGTQDDWRIFYKGKDSDNKDRIFIIADDYVLNTKTATARNLAKMEKNATYDAYWSSVPSFEDRMECAVNAIYGNRIFFKEI